MIENIQPDIVDNLIKPVGVHVLGASPGTGATRFAAALATTIVDPPPTFLDRTTGSARPEYISLTDHNQLSDQVIEYAGGTSGASSRFMTREMGLSDLNLRLNGESHLGGPRRLTIIDAVTFNEAVQGDLYARANRYCEKNRATVLLIVQLSSKPRAEEDQVAELRRMYPNIFALSRKPGSPESHNLTLHVVQLRSAGSNYDIHFQLVQDSATSSVRTVVDTAPAPPTTKSEAASLAVAAYLKGKGGTTVSHKELEAIAMASGISKRLTTGVIATAVAAAGNDVQRRELPLRGGPVEYAIQGPPVRSDAEQPPLASPETPQEDAVSDGS